MSTDVPLHGFRRKAPALLCSLFVAVSVGLMLEVVRFYVYSHMAVNSTFERLPKISHFFILLPSPDLHARHPVYVLLFTLPWLLLLKGAARMSPSECDMAACRRMIVTLVAGLLVAVAMLYPCFPRMTALPPKELKGTFWANVIAAAFYMLAGMIGWKLIFAAFRGMKAKTKASDPD